MEQKVAYFKRSVRHDRMMIGWFLSRHAPRTLERRSEIGWYLNALTWHRHLLAQYTAKLLPNPRTYAGPCLASIFDREDPSWDPTISYGGGHNIYDPYGLGQANPGTKMAPFGADWRTNPYTQIRWARSYALQRYGGECAAWAHWQANWSW